MIKVNATAMKKPALIALSVALVPQLIWCAGQLFASNTPLDQLTRPFIFTAALLAVAVTRGNVRLINTFARFTIGGAFLLALWNRFDDFSRFIAYTGVVNSFLPRSTDPTLAVAATIAEITFCTTMLLGFRVRLAAAGSGVLLFLFATAMTISGLTQFDWAVYVLAAGGLTLATVDASTLSLDSPPAGNSHLKTDRSS